MTEDSKKSRRRRRRPRSTAKNRAKAAAKAPAAENKSSASSRRGRSRRRPTSSKAKKRASQETLTIQKHSEKPISPIDKNIFIYTYTLRPRSLLEDYEVGPKVAEKMAFEGPEERTLSD